ncbi:MAG TPA: hypothetical protein VHD91_01165 [Gaiellaceae bacterium]|nr:hypothetical protein [Gaiellaceae bacterium]
MKTLLACVATAAVSFGVAATTGLGARSGVGGARFTFRNTFDRATAPDLNFACQYSEKDPAGPTQLLCGHFASLNVGGTTVALPLGLTLRITAARISIERYGDQGYLFTYKTYHR